MGMRVVLCQFPEVVYLCPAEGSPLYTNPNGYLGALNVGSPMSPFDFKKWQRLLSLFFLDFPVDFKNVQCCLSFFRNENIPCSYFFLNFLSILKCLPCQI